MDQDLTQFSDRILCDDSTGCVEVDIYFVIEGDTIIAILHEYVLDEDWFWKFAINRNIFKLSCMIV